MEENKKTQKEEKKTKKEPAVKKLSYEELENAARQISVQLDAAIKENRQLKEVASQLQLGNLYTELGFRFKVIEFQDSFNPDFVESCINEIESIMNRDSEDSKEEDNKEKN